jgi:general secretion pathway protein H
MPILALKAKLMSIVLGPIRSQAVPVQMRMSASNKEKINSLAQTPSEGGFTLVEMLLVLGIVAILLTVAVLTIPNHDERNWRNNLDQLVTSLNAAQDESQMTGIPMRAEISESGWRFSKSDPMNQTRDSNQPPTFIPDAYKAQTWSKPVVMEPLQLNLGAEYVSEGLRTTIEQEKRTATLIRSNDGHFSWVSP